MFGRATGAAMDFVQSLGLGTNEARKKNHLTSEAVAEERHIQWLETDTGAVDRATHICNPAPHNGTPSHRDSRSTGKINFLNEDMLGQYRHGEGASQCTAQVNPSSNPVLKDRNTSLTDEFELLKRSHASLKKHCQDLQAKADAIDNENVRLRLHKKDLEQQCEGLYTHHSEVEKRFFGLYSKATGTEDLYHSLVDDILQVAPEGRTAIRKTPIYQKEIHSLRTEKRLLHSQVNALQQELLSNVEKQSAVSDEQFTQGFRWLAATIKTLSRKICFPDGIQLAETSEFTSAVLLKDVDNAQWSGRGRKKAVVEAFIWSTLITTVFGSPFEVFGVEANKVASAWFELFGGAHSESWPTPSDPAERGRCITVERLVQHSGKEGIAHGSPGTPSRLNESISNKRDEFYKHLFETMGGISPTTEFSPLSAVINKAFSLALEMSLQRCRLRVLSPLIGEAYSQGRTCHMTSIDEDGEVEEGTVGFIVQPGLVKWGDSHGKKLDHSLVLVPSEVYVLP